jgi:hypothetical protein
MKQYLKSRKAKVILVGLGVVVAAGLLAIVNYPGLFKNLLTDTKPQTAAASANPESTSETRLSGATEVNTGTSSGPSQAADTPAGPTARTASSTCTKQTIPYKSVTKSDDSLAFGKTRTTAGRDGYSYHCSDGRAMRGVDPIEAVAYIGTKVSKTADKLLQPVYTYSEALGLAKRNCSSLLGILGHVTDATTESCMQLYLNKLGF